MSVVGGTMGIWATGKPTHTAVARWGVNPAKAASAKFWAVPVLPAAGRPNWARWPVPLATAPSSTQAIWSATLRSSARLGSERCSYSEVPSELRMEVTITGSTRRPDRAKVEYTVASSTMFTSSVPSTAAHTGAMRSLPMPSSSAMRTKFDGRTSIMSWA